MGKIIVEFTQEEANQLVQLLDVAVKAGGLGNAKVALPIFEKIIQSANKPKE